ncbi:MAG: hypothetical protein A2Y80_09320 [Deltaproteobacteria bacterium RBG_13_58_19]|nr:MAG: hypothetical protein A2Y80_09320 [Deltaproteobacteria bacterium RBG_13_58_19]
MQRREFLQRVTLALAAAWAGRRWVWPGAAGAGAPPPILALLADAHLPDGHAGSPEARALARAVAEIRALSPAPDLVLFAGDLAHDGDGQALALGKDILGDLPGTLILVQGEGDVSPDSPGDWQQLFGEAGFLHTYRGLNLLGLHTAWLPAPTGPVFQVGKAQARWLAQELPRLEAETPLIILSHAPLDQIFHPWQHWTADASRLLPLLTRFSNVLCLHGHVHQAGAININNRLTLNSENRKPKTENLLTHQSLPSTSWPLPLPLQGTPASLCPGLGPQGCGWGLVAISADSLEYRPHIWQV